MSPVSKVSRRILTDKVVPVFYLFALLYVHSRLSTYLKKELLSVVTKICFHSWRRPDFGCLFCLGPLCSEIVVTICVCGDVPPFVHQGDPKSSGSFFTTFTLTARSLTQKPETNLRPVLNHFYTTALDGTLCILTRLGFRNFMSPDIVNFFSQSCISSLTSHRFHQDWEDEPKSLINVSMGHFHSSHFG